MRNLLHQLQMGQVREPLVAILLRVAALAGLGEVVLLKMLGRDPGLERFRAEEVAVAAAQAGAHAGVVLSVLAEVHVGLVLDVGPGDRGVKGLGRLTFLGGARLERVVLVAVLMVGGSTRWATRLGAERGAILGLVRVGASTLERLFGAKVRERSSLWDGSMLWTGTYRFAMRLAGVCVLARLVGGVLDAAAGISEATGNRSMAASRPLR